MKTNYGLSWRALIIYFVLILLLGALIGRIFFIQINDKEFLDSKGESLLYSNRPIVPLRGGILDRNDFPLALSINQYDLFALRNFSHDEYIKLKKIVPIIKSFKSIIELNKKTLLFSKLDFSQYEQIKQLRIDSIEIETSQKRYYPLGEQIAPLVGFAGKEGKGLEGLEKALDVSLSGVAGSERLIQNASRKVIKRPILITPAIKGESINLTIDSRIQFYTFKHLSRFIEANKAKGGSAIVLDNHSGEILAMASYPSYNPNDPNRVIQRNRPLLDAFEPGSIIKPLVLAKAIDLGLISLEESINTHPGFISLNGEMISDSSNYQTLSYKEVIAKSSQVGVSKLALFLGIDGLIAGYKSFGLSKPPDLYFPNLAYGTINARPNISDHEIASLGFGYNMTASSLQLAQAYSVFANKGYMKDFKLFMSIEDSEKYPVISSETASDVLEALELVVTDGTGLLAKPSGYLVAGKTGTSHKTRLKGGYDKSKYISSFAGIAPLGSKRLTIFVSVDEPGLNNYSGGAVGAPLFAAIAKDILSYLDE